jgi:hypothetical protein
MRLVSRLGFCASPFSLICVIRLIGSFFAQAAEQELASLSPQVNLLQPGSAAAGELPRDRDLLCFALFLMTGALSAHATAYYDVWSSTQGTSGAGPQCAGMKAYFTTSRTIAGIAQNTVSEASKCYLWLGFVTSSA